MAGGPWDLKLTTADDTYTKTDAFSISLGLAREASMSILLSRLTAQRAIYLDNLSEGKVALQATLEAIVGEDWSAATGSLSALAETLDIMRSNLLSDKPILQAQLTRGKIDALSRSGFGS